MVTRNQALRQAEREMDAIFLQLARDIGQVVLRAAGEDGTVPVERLGAVQAEARRLVDAVFVGANGKPFGEKNEPLAPYPRVIAEGQLAMVDLAFEGMARVLNRYLTEEDRAALNRRMALTPGPSPRGRGV